MIQLLRFVNDTINALDYVHEETNRDVWQAPAAFIANGCGDCEDFAIAKYFMLRGFGVPADKLQLLYCLTPAAHILLVVKTDDGDRVLDLRNRSPDVYDIEDLNAMPVYAFNEDVLYVVENDWTYTRAGSAMVIKRWAAIINKVEHRHSI